MRAVLAVLMLMLALPAWAGTPREKLVVTPAWVAEHLADPDLVILQVGDKAGFETSHIRRALHRSRLPDPADAGVRGPAGAAGGAGGV